MNRTWQDDKAWTDQYLPSIKLICGYYFIGEAPDEEDRKRNTDLIVLNIAGLRIAVRIRHDKYWYEKKNGRFRYRGDFTIRWARPNHTTTEFEKIVKEGLGDYFFYAFANDNNPPRLFGFGILNLAIFRQWAITYFQKYGTWPGEVIHNRSDGTQGRVFKWADVPPEAILCSYPKDVASGIALAPDDLRRHYQATLEYLTSLEEKGS